MIGRTNEMSSIGGLRFVWLLKSCCEDGVFLGEQRARSYSTTTPGLYPCLLVSLDDALVSLDDALVFTRGRKGTLFRALLRIHAMQARIDRLSASTVQVSSTSESDPRTLHE